MSLRPRIFVSAVTTEFGQARQLVANILQRLGYEPVFQEIFGTEAGDLRQVLREQIDSCDGLVQLVGRAYGAEPPTVDAEFGRVSYTQFEFLYAQARGKKTWLFLAQDACERDCALAELDLPTRSPGMAIPGLPALPAAAEDYQRERRALQDAYRERLQQSGHLWHPVGDLRGLQLVIGNLRDEYADLRRGFRSWQRTVLRLAAMLLGLMLVVGLGVWWTVFRQPAEIAKVIDDSAAKVTETVKTTVEASADKVAAQVVEQLADPDQIRLQLQKTIETTYQRELAEADALPDWEKRDAAKKEVTAARDKRLSEIDEFIASVTSTLKSGEASPEYRELNRIIQEQGVAAALKYIAGQEERLLQEARQLAQAAKLKIRQKLAPLLESVKLLQTQGDYRAARQRCEELLATDDTWRDVRHEHFVVLVNLGDRALRYETVSTARRYFDAAGETAELAAAADPTDAQAQRDLAVSYERFGQIHIQTGDLAKARDYFEKELVIAEARMQADPASAEAKRFTSVVYNFLGDVTLQSGDTQAALGFFQQCHKILRKLAAADPTDAQAQRDLMVSHYKLGGVRQADGDFVAAAGDYRAGMAVLDQMIAAGQNVEQSQKERGVLEQQVQTCAVLELAVGDWEALLKLPAESVALILPARCTWLAKKQRTADVAQAAAHLQTLEPVTASNLYNAACGFGLCLKLASGWDGKSDFPPKAGLPEGTSEEQTARKEYRAQAVAAFQAAVEKGYDKFDDARQDADLAGLHGDAEFQALLK